MNSEENNCGGLFVIKLLVVAALLTFITYFAFPETQPAVDSVFGKVNAEYDKIPKLNPHTVYDWNKK